MRNMSSIVCCSLLLPACVSAAPPIELGHGGSAVSKRKQFELNSVADEIKYESGDVLSAAAKHTAYDECLSSLDCSYCRKQDGWWMLQSCSK